MDAVALETQERSSTDAVVEGPGVTIVQTVIVRSLADAVVTGTPSRGLLRYFESIVRTNLSEFSWEADSVHRVLFAYPEVESAPVAFCYYFLGPRPPDMVQFARLWSPAEDCAAPSSVGWLFGVYVDEEYRGQGLASELIDAAARDLYGQGWRTFQLPFEAKDVRDRMASGRLRRRFETGGFVGATFRLASTDEVVITGG